MAAPDLSRVFAASGRLAKNCTDLALAWPHGGTGLGLVGEVSLAPQRASRTLIAEEFNAPYGIVHAGGPLEMRCRVRGWETDAISSLFRGGSIGGGAPLITWPTGVGGVVTALTNVVFTPDAASLSPAPPFAVLFGVVAVPEDEAAFRLTAFRFLDIRLRLIATASGTTLGKMGASGSVGVP